MVNSCGECLQCEKGLEQHCLKSNIGTYAATDVDGTLSQGGYAEQIVVTKGSVLRSEKYPPG